MKKKIYLIFKVLLCLIFAAVIMLDSMIEFSGELARANMSTVYFKNMEVKNIIIFFVALVITYLVISLLEYISDKLESTIYEKKRKEKNIKIYFIILVVIFICWLPTILSYFSGGIYVDTISSINEALSVTPLTNRNPLLYTLILKLFLTIGKAISSYQLGMNLFAICQILVMLILVSYSVYWLYKKGIATKYIVIVTLLFGFIRLMPLYALSIWKDTPFCLALFAFSIFIAEIVYQDGKNLEKISGIIKYLILLLLVCFLRNNGIYVGTAVTLILIFTYNRKKAFIISSIITIVLTYIVQGPVFKKVGLSAGTETVESFGVPLQQICYVVANDEEKLTDQQKEFINNICKMETIKNKYNPLLVDPIKWNSEFNNVFLMENKNEFLKMWLKILTKAPGDYVKAYLLNTLGFWDVNKATMDAYINPQMWGNKDQKEVGEIEFTQADYIQKLSGHSMRNIVTPTKAVSSALFLFIALFSAIITLYKKRYKNLLIYLPGIATWGTIMLAAPIAFSLRYVFILALMIPIIIFIPFLKQKKEIDTKDQENNKIKMLDKKKEEK